MKLGNLYFTYFLYGKNVFSFGCCYFIKILVYIFVRFYMSEIIEIYGFEGYGFVFVYIVIFVIVYYEISRD